MGREVRMVPEDWKHPKYVDGRFIALFNNDFEECARDWDQECKEWDSGVRPEYCPDEYKDISYSEWGGERPRADEYMPTWEDHEKTHLMMYETTSEGTPISPAFKTPEELARWLVDNDASAFGGSKASYEGWLRVAQGGYAPSAVAQDGSLKTGVDGF